MLARSLCTALAIVVAIGIGTGIVADADEETVFLDAARDGDLETVQRLHGEGVDVNAGTRYGATALAYACDKGHLEVVRYLIDNGAEINVSDSFYEFTPIGWALFNDHDEIVKLLMASGSTGADQVLSTAVRKNKIELIKLALASDEINADHVAEALEAARELEDGAAIVALLEAVDLPPVEHDELTIEPAALQSFVGKYNNASMGVTIDVRLEEDQLVAQAGDQPPLKLRAIGEAKFEAIERPQIRLSFTGRGGTIERAILNQGGESIHFPRVAAQAETAPAEPELPAEVPEIVYSRKAGAPWPSFRGPAGSGVADGQGVPSEWNVETGTNVRWKTPIPGLGNSSPIIWGKRVFVTTAVSSAEDKTFRTGLYGDVDSVDDLSRHEFSIYALSKKNGKVLWQRTVATEVPGAKRHLKSTQANSTPVTDGKHVVVLFGAIGVLACYDLDGKELWKSDVGLLDSGWFYDRTYQWGHASSPVIYKDLVIVQADIAEGSFIAAYRLADGKQAWKTAREDVPSWGSPTVYLGASRDELITNGVTVRGYDPKTGSELWKLAPNSEVTVATPVIAHGMFYVTAGYPPVRPIYAIRPGGNGDISLAEETESNETIAWSKSRGGTYMPTPIVYGDYLYTCANNGRLTCYNAKNGEQVYRTRVGDSGSFTASPIASDGRLYFTEETGEVHVVRAGETFEELATNEMQGIVMSTPAISDGLLVVRTLDHVYGLGAE